MPATSRMRKSREPRHGVRSTRNRASRALETCCHRDIVSARPAGTNLFPPRLRSLPRGQQGGQVRAFAAGADFACHPGVGPGDPAERHVDPQSRRASRSPRPAYRGCAAVPRCTARRRTAEPVPRPRGPGAFATRALQQFLHQQFQVGAFRRHRRRSVARPAGAQVGHLHDVPAYAGFAVTPLSYGDNRAGRERKRGRDAHAQAPGAAGDAGGNDRRRSRLRHGVWRSTGGNPSPPTTRRWGTCQSVAASTPSRGGRAAGRLAAVRRRRPSAPTTARCPPRSRPAGRARRAAPGRSSSTRPASGRSGSTRGAASRRPDKMVDAPRATASTRQDLKVISRDNGTLIYTYVDKTRGPRMGLSRWISARRRQAVTRSRSPSAAARRTRPACAPSSSRPPTPCRLRRAAIPAPTST